jgi:hypothetical protein
MQNRTSRSSSPTTTIFFVAGGDHGLLLYDQLEDPRPGDVVQAVQRIGQVYTDPSTIVESIPGEWVCFPQLWTSVSQTAIPEPESSGNSWLTAVKTVDVPRQGPSIVCTIVSRRFLGIQRLLGLMK